MAVLRITPLAHLEETLASSGSRWLASFAAPGSTLPRPDGLDGFLALDFNNIPKPLDGLQAVTAEQVEILIAFIRAWNGAGPLVLQCWMGVSRSTAAAVIAAAVIRSEMAPATLVAALRMAAPHATPNPLMIALADTQLGYGGTFSQAVKEAGRGAFITHAPSVSFDLDIGP